MVAWFECKVPEVYDGTVETPARQREPSDRSVATSGLNDPNVDPVELQALAKGFPVQIINELVAKT